MFHSYAKSSRITEVILAARTFGFSLLCAAPGLVFQPSALRHRDLVVTPKLSRVFATLQSASKYTLLLLLLTSFAGRPPARAQQLEPGEKSPRKLVSRVDPAYPEDLRRAEIGGLVRLDIVVAAGGRVDDIVVAGGNPILAESAARAVKQWKYAPSNSVSNIRINLRFNPHR